MRFYASSIILDKNTQDIKAFDCGKPKMNTFLSRFAFKHSKLGLSSTWVVLEQVDSMQNNQKSKIAAYYTLASSIVIKSGIPTQQSLPHYPIPVVLLARLAVDNKYQGDGLGAKLLVTALRHAVELTNQGLPAYGLVLDVLDDDALSFYRYFDFFEPFTDDPIRLFIGMDSIKKL